ncbi:MULTISPECIES: acyl-CoA thioesterase [Hymenobacter]|uniref:Acyl-CoA thioester hydrolase n=1 Tax=Hymenobacter mucosus TaxID=1411120 RepID=A0A238XIJ2_9BACT|nr:MULTISPECIES: acyl-CoA thioesterase [Hymenobacter]SNR57769.1 acyl-CoA thioester hydrolase [Hymenobacter mucosus]
MDTPIQPAFRFSRQIIVQPHDIDELDHANNVQYVRWVQDTAGEHWLTAYPPGEREHYIWVVREHRIQYRHPALLGEQLRCTTWIGEVRGAQCQRFVHIERATDNKLLCEAETQWVLLDPHSKRPMRIEPEVVTRLWRPVG